MGWLTPFDVDDPDAEEEEDGEEEREDGEEEERETRGSKGLVLAGPPNSHISSEVNTVTSEGKALYPAGLNLPFKGFFLSLLPLLSFSRDLDGDNESGEEDGEEDEEE